MEIDIQLLNQAGIPSRYWNDFEDSFVPKNTMKKAEEYVRLFDDEFPNTGVFLYGIQDSGKTSTACFILMQALMRGHTVRRFTIDELTDAYYERKGVFEMGLRGNHILAIDSVNHLARPHQGKVDALERSLAVCKEWELPCLLCSDVDSLDDFEQHYGHRSYHLVDRYFLHWELKPNQMKMRDHFDAGKPNI